jgi:hypothetical protein
LSDQQASGHSLTKDFFFFLVYNSFFASQSVSQSLGYLLCLFFCSLD